MTTPPPHRVTSASRGPILPPRLGAEAGSAVGQAATRANRDCAQRSLFITAKSGEMASRREEVELKALALQIFTQKQWRKLLGSHSGQPSSLLPHFPTCPEAKCLADARSTFPHFPSLPTTAADSPPREVFFPLPQFPSVLTGPSRLPALCS